jgi:MFS family permease
MFGTFSVIAAVLGQNIIWGRVADKYKLRAKLMFLGESLAFFSYVGIFYLHKTALSTASSFAAGLILVLGLSALEFFWSMTEVGWAALIADLTTSETRGSTVGVLNFVGTSGRLIGISLAGFFYKNGIGYSKGTLFYMASAAIFSCALTMLWLSRTKTPKKIPIKTNLPTNLYGERDEDKDRFYWWFFASLAIVILGAASINQVFLLFLGLTEGLNASNPEVSLILTFWTIGGMITSVLSGRLADRVGKARVLLFGFILTALIPLIYGFVQNVPIMAITYGVNGAAFWSVQTISFALAGDMIPIGKRGRLFSIYNAIMSLTWGPAGLFIGGPIADIQTEVFGIPRYKAYVNTFTVSSMIVLTGTLLFFLKVKRRYTKTDNSS